MKKGDLVKKGVGDKIDIPKRRESGTNNTPKEDRPSIIEDTKKSLK